MPENSQLAKSSTQHKKTLYLKNSKYSVLSCRWPDSNRHGSLRMILSHVRLPIPPHRQLNTDNYFIILIIDMQEKIFIHPDISVPEP